ncbi:MarR family winged helix-turn-helix transcriptional regulator [Variovorax sp. J22P271]|uniref:MarR family winged helix-turn-helix transcriptional regulator n=1 Tax=Variovorax davisae TaxID=3053515 RepID=UPI002575A489|nr:MarR family winged helix-turn-helix transcriptional regulator [Variovorax sp. J22P271]MDM0032518.1 MarR family winged helix-turn-helix transcriptional regulator [Variovorax sp. J22P271]
MPNINTPSSVDLSSFETRDTLPARAKPYWHIHSPRTHLGYYKGSRGAAWYGRMFIGDGKYKQAKLGPCKEEGGADARGLTFELAIESLLRWAESEQSGEAPGAPAPDRSAAGAGRSVRSASQLQPTRLDAISQAWAQERPDVDFWLPGFFLRIEYAHYLHDRRVQEVAKKAGVTVGDLHVLLALRRNGTDSAMRPTDLYRELLVTSGAITKRLDSLREQKFIERAAAEGDRRSELVKLTRRGLAIADTAMTRIAQSLEGIVKASGVRRDELREMDDCFRRLIAAM